MSESGKSGSVTVIWAAVLLWCVGDVEWLAWWKGGWKKNSRIAGQPSNPAKQRTVSPEWSNEGAQNKLIYAGLVLLFNMKLPSIY
jgi:hypothetical protein